MLRFLGSKPDINVFGGTYSNLDENGSININGKGNTANITLINKNNQKTEASITAYNLSTLEKTSDYQSMTEEENDEHLVNIWKTRRDHNKMIKYSGREQLTFVISGNGDLDALVKNEYFRFCNLDYFNEIKFCHLLKKKAGLSIHELRNTLDNEERVQQLFNNATVFDTLLSHQITIQEISSLNDELFQLILKNDAIMTIINSNVTLNQLKEIDFNKLSQCVENVYSLNDALEFLTIEQVLGINHIAKPLTQAATHRDKAVRTDLHRGRFGDGSSGPFIHEYNNHTITIQHEKTQSKFIVYYNRINDPETLVAINKIINELEPIELLHPWFCIKNTNESNQKLNILFCPALQVVQQETIDSLFPEAEFRNNHDFCLYSTVYYQENLFIKFLKEQGHFISDLKQLPNMSIEKLELLCDHRYDLDFLLEAGVSIADFAKVDFDRLSCILNNSYKANHALKFVSATELLGLHDMTKTYSQKLFDTPSANVVTTEPSNRCVMM